jgi:hypothetical protein
MPFSPTSTRPKPLAEAMAMTTWMAVSLWKRPSPPSTSVAPCQSLRQSKIDWTKFSR